MLLAASLDLFLLIVPTGISTFGDFKAYIAAFAFHVRRPIHTQQAPQATSSPARAPPGLNSSFSTDNGV